MTEPIRIRLLLTGNGPFRLCPVNPSARLAQHFAIENIETSIKGKDGKDAPVQIRLSVQSI